MSLAGCRFPVCHFLGKNYSANSTTDTAPVFLVLFQIARPKINMKSPTPLSLIVVTLSPDDRNWKFIQLEVLRNSTCFLPKYWII